jgi:hypothetical protein
MHSVFMRELHILPKHHVLVILSQYIQFVLHVTYCFLLSLERKVIISFFVQVVGPQKQGHFFT